MINSIIKYIFYSLFAGIVPVPIEVPLTRRGKFRFK